MLFEKARERDAIIQAVALYDHGSVLREGQINIGKLVDQIQRVLEESRRQFVQNGF